MAIGRSHVVRWPLLAATIFCLAMGCGPASTPEPTPLQFPLQSPIDPTPTRAPAETPTNPPSPTATPIAASPTPPADQPGRELTPTPDMLATSASVIATLTAQTIPPTFPPTATPRRRPVGSGAGAVTRAPTRTPDPSRIALVALSERVYAGSAGTLTIRTQPKATCTVQMARARADGGHQIISIDGATRQAGDDGVIAWIWVIPADASAGAATISVTCAGIGAAEYAIEIVR
jgi:hypothetical protein